MGSEEGLELESGRSREELIAELRAVRAENAALRRSESLLRAVIAGIENAACTRIPGSAADEILGREDAECFAPETARRTGDAGRSVMVEGRTPSLEDKATSAGVTRTRQTTKGQRRDERGLVGGIALELTGSAGPLAERERLTRRLRLQIDRLPLAYVLMDSEARVLDWNPAAEELFGYTKAEATGRSCLDLVLPDPPDNRMQEIIRRMHAGEMVPHSINANRTKGGRAITCAWFNTPLRDPEGRYAGAICLAQDVTERERAEELLARDAQLLANVRDSVIVTDPEGIVTYWNAGSTRIFGWRAEEMLGRPLMDRVPEEGRAAMLAAIRAIAEGEEFSGEWEDYRRDGSRVWINARVTRMTDAAGRTVGLLGVAHDISERKRAEEALRERDEVLRSFYDGAPMMMGVVEADGEELVFVSVNLPVAAFFARDAESMRGLPVSELGEPGTERHLTLWTDRLDEARRTGSSVHFEYALTSPIGSRRLSANVCPIAGGHAGRPRFSFIVEDVTERRRAEAELAEWEARYEAAVQATGQVLYDWDIATNEVVYGGNCAAILGFTPAELTGDLACWVALIHPEDRPAFEAETERVRSSREPFLLEYRAIRRDGTTIVVRDQSHFVRDGTGAPTRLIGFISDITERKRSEEALTAGERRFRQVLENSRDVVYQLDLSSGCYNYLSPSAREVLGRNPEEFAAGGLALAVSLLHPEDFSRMADHLARLRAPRRGDEFEPTLEYRLHVPGKGWRWMNDSGTVIRDPSGLPVAVVGTVRDVTDQRLAAERLRELSRRLIRAQEDERRHIAHELHDEIGQALTALKLNLLAVQRDAAGPAAAQRLAESVDLVKRTIGQVRDLSLDLRPSMLDDLGLLDALRSYVSRFGQRSGTEARLVAAESVGRLDPDVETACYRIAQEALTNVARHAGAARVTIELGRSASELQLVVTDDGVGFDVSAATARAAAESSLGILGMRERATFVGGHVEIESERGRGSVVRARFPLGEARPAGGDVPPGGLGHAAHPRHPGR